jgi:predicted metal-dependent phosphoesterase TrpH
MRGGLDRPAGRGVDLHVHTYFSDGTLSPEAVVALATERGLAALSITDHDSLESLDRARLAVGPSLDLVPGIELSSLHEGLDLHILGYYVDPAHEGLSRRLERFREDRQQRAMAMIQLLRGLGFELDASEVVHLAGPGVIGRPHIARALVKAGHVPSLDDAFRQYLGRGGRAFVPRTSFKAEEAIDLVHAAGGVSVIAHPGPLLPERIIEDLADAGLRGIETWHPQHSGATVRRYRALAQRLNLLETGGSDFHGAHRGPDLGGVRVPLRAWHRLRDFAGVAG